MPENEEHKKTGVLPKLKEVANDIFLSLENNHLPVIIMVLYYLIFTGVGVWQDDLLTILGYASTPVVFGIGLLYHSGREKRLRKEANEKMKEVRMEKDRKIVTLDIDMLYTQLSYFESLNGLIFSAVRRNDALTGNELLPVYLKAYSTVYDNLSSRLNITDHEEYHNTRDVLLAGIRGIPLEEPEKNALLTRIDQMNSSIHKLRQRFVDSQHKDSYET